MLLWRLEIEGRGSVIGPLPSTYYLENWENVTQAAGPYAVVRLASDGGHVLTPIAGDDVVAWWRVDPQGVVRPSLRAAFAHAEAKGNPSKASRLS
ncbi:hypothetical protein [Paludisphaera rhizosphaerae]|uniref:hypothetical protein n=1 Tax=Paludisphaera rhizosphaerae TaxID=2711216 RepID=UPI0013E9ABBC|nr:hypothetical protein [Paludisphaera rhizosphaerae]